MLLHLSEFFDKSLTINCPQITVKQKVSNSPKVYQGSGSITRTSTRQLKVELSYPDGDILSSFVGEISKEYDDKAGKTITDKSAGVGKIVPEDKYFDLHATDEQGREWTGKRFLIEKVFQNSQVTLVAQLNEISHTAQLLSNENISLRLQLSDVINIHFFDFKFFSACGHQFSIEYKDDCTLIQVDFNCNELPDSIETRICEAFQFILGNSVSWTTIELNQNNHRTTRIQSLFNRDRRDKKTEVLPPLRHSTDDTQKLFEKYLQHVLTYPQEEFHPISGWIKRIIEARTTTFEAEILTLSVAIEGLLDMEPFKSIPIDSVESQVSLVQNKIKELNLEESFINRLNGLLGMLKSASPRDKFKYLEDKGLIDRKLVKAWKRLRNGAAHGYVVERDKFSEYFKRRNQVIVLFNQLIFLLIGYTGKYTAYSEAGWTEKEFNSLIDKSN